MPDRHMPHPARQQAQKQCQRNTDILAIGKQNGKLAAPPKRHHRQGRVPSAKAARQANDRRGLAVDCVIIQYLDSRLRVLLNRRGQRVVIHRRMTAPGDLGFDTRLNDAGDEQQGFHYTHSLLHEACQKTFLHRNT